MSELEPFTKFKTLTEVRAEASAQASALAEILQTLGVERLEAYVKFQKFAGGIVVSVPLRPKMISTSDWRAVASDFNHIVRRMIVSNVLLWELDSNLGTLVFDSATANFLLKKRGSK